jgi:hypothetical protein
MRSPCCLPVNPLPQCVHFLCSPCHIEVASEITLLSVCQFLAVYVI